LGRLAEIEVTGGSEQLGRVSISRGSGSKALVPGVTVNGNKWSVYHSNLHRLQYYDDVVLVWWGIWTFNDLPTHIAA